MRPAVRAGVVLLAVGLLACHLVAFAAAFGGSPAYPDTGRIDATYEQRVGESVNLWGRAVAVGDEGFSLRAGALRLRVRSAAPVAVGDYVQVYGVLRPGHELDARRVATQSPGEHRYTYAVSALALPVVAVAFLRRWRVAGRSLAFVPRSPDGRGGDSGAAADDDADDVGKTRDGGPGRG